MMLPFDVISGVLLLEALLNENIINQGQYDRIDKHFDDLRNANNYTLVITSELTDFIDESQYINAINLVKSKCSLTPGNSVYLAI
tara:strand:+ start:723 stop:977 length:255 start_codon:yes stop_codon:yes gene_type:complete